jgi:cytochrome b561
MSGAYERFALPARLLHWAMAVMIIAMLFIGAGMVSTVSAAHTRLLAWHKPIGITILLLALVRIVVRRIYPPPAMPADMPAWQHQAAWLSHILLYALMIAMPMIGWTMLAAGGYPVQIFSRLRLPAIAPHNLGLYSVLHGAHTYLAYLFFLTILMHLAAAMFHGLIRVDAVFPSMELWSRRGMRNRIVHEERSAKQSIKLTVAARPETPRHAVGKETASAPEPKPEQTGNGGSRVTAGETHDQTSEAGPPIHAPRVLTVKSPRHRSARL